MTLCSLVATEFAKYPLLPGVMIIENGQVLGAFSRQKFLEQVGQRYGVAVYFKRPIRLMLKVIAPQNLILAGDVAIHTAAELALKRPVPHFYEPVIVQYPDKTFGLLDIYMLLLAQSRLLSLSYQVEQNRRQLAESLQEIGRVLSSSLDLRQVPGRILNELDNVVAYERGLVLLKNENHLESIAQRGFPADERAKNFKIPIQTGRHDIFQQLVQTGEPVIVDDVIAQPGWRQVEWLPVHRSWLGVPLIAQDQVIGMISLTRSEKNAFNTDDATLVLAFAGQAAIALENARLYDHITQFNNELERMVNQRTQELNEAYQVLEKIDKTKSDFIHISGHELRTPITVIKGYAQLLKVNPKLKNDTDIEGILDGIESGMDRLHQIVNSMLDVARIDSDSLLVRREAVGVAMVVKQLAAKFKPDLKQRRLSLTLIDLHELPPIHGDPNLLTKVFYCLIINAIQYTPDGGSITVAGQLSSSDSTEWVEITVADTGIGIDPDHLELIFEKFYQTGRLALHSSGYTKFKAGGPGLGLAIARGIIEAHQGQIWAESPGHDEERCPGSKFRVRLPLP